jgi:hypothetical protein
MGLWVGGCPGLWVLEPSIRWCGWWCGSHGSLGLGCGSPGPNQVPWVVSWVFLSHSPVKNKSGSLQIHAWTEFWVFNG